MDTKTNIAKQNMIEQQIRSWDVMDPKVLEVFKKVDRANFAHHDYLAYADVCLPISETETMLEPKIEAKMLQALDIKPEDNIFEVGVGSGYLIALLASLGASVDSIEIDPKILDCAQKRLVKFNNVTITLADVFDYHPDKKYNIIVISGALTEIPEQIKDSLLEDGKLFAFIKQASGIIVATLIQRLTTHDWSQELLFETNVLQLKQPHSLSTDEFDF